MVMKDFPLKEVFGFLINIHKVDSGDAILCTENLMVLLEVGLFSRKAIHNLALYISGLLDGRP